MKPPPSPAQILVQIAQIPAMELGKLCEYERPDRGANSGRYLRLQHWQDGKNCTRHVRPEELPALQQALEGYARFRTLCDQYAQLIVEQTRARHQAEVKKKIPPYSRHCRKKSSASSSRS